MEEKVKELRFYSGAKFETGLEVPAGYICAALGLSQTYPDRVWGQQLTPCLPCWSR